MGSMTFVIDRRGASVELDRKGVVVVSYPDGQHHRIGLKALAQLVVVGEVGLSSGLLRHCHEEGVSVSLLPGRGRGSGCEIVAAHQGRLKRRLIQYRLHFDDDARLGIAREVVINKIAAQRELLLSLGVGVGLERFEHEAQRAESLQSLMGVEGAAAARYFHAWGEIWPDTWGFKGRNRRPPRDPVNAMLSLGYTLAGQYLARLATRHGLDTAVGFLHEPANGRPALVLDLLEPVRAAVDQHIWELMEGGRIAPNNFVLDPDLGCRLTKEGRGAFFGEWFTGEDRWLARPSRLSMARVLWRIHRKGLAS